MFMFEMELNYHISSLTHNVNLQTWQIISIYFSVETGISKRVGWQKGELSYNLLHEL